jgi:hypothetical protein
LPSLERDANDLGKELRCAADRREAIFRVLFAARERRIKERRNPALR